MLATNGTSISISWWKTIAPGNNSIVRCAVCIVRKSEAHMKLLPKHNQQEHLHPVHSEEHVSRIKCAKHCPQLDACVHKWQPFAWGFWTDVGIFLIPQRVKRAWKSEPWYSGPWSWTTLMGQGYCMSQPSSIACAACNADGVTIWTSSVRLVTKSMIVTAYTSTFCPQILIFHGLIVSTATSNHGWKFASLGGSCP